MEMTRGTPRLLYGVTYGDGYLYRLNLETGDIKMIAQKGKRYADGIIHSFAWISNSAHDYLRLRRAWPPSSRGTLSYAANYEGMFEVGSALPVYFATHHPDVSYGSNIPPYSPPIFAGLFFAAMGDAITDARVVGASCEVKESRVTLGGVEPGITSIRCRTDR